MTEEDESYLEEMMEENPELKTSLRQAMSGRIPEFQSVVDDDTIYCEKCEGEYDYTPSVLSIHNLRRHEYAPDIYDYSNWQCSECGSRGQFSGTTGQSGTSNLLVCEKCGELQ